MCTVFFIPIVYTVFKSWLLLNDAVCHVFDPQPNELKDSSPFNPFNVYSVQNHWLLYLSRICVCFSVWLVLCFQGLGRQFIMF